MKTQWWISVKRFSLVLLRYPKRKNTTICRMLYGRWFLLLRLSYPKKCSKTIFALKFNLFFHSHIFLFGIPLYFISPLLPAYWKIAGQIIVLMNMEQNDATNWPRFTKQSLFSLSLQHQQSRQKHGDDNASSRDRHDSVTRSSTADRHQDRHAEGCGKTKDW